MTNNSTINTTHCKSTRHFSTPRTKLVPISFSAFQKPIIHRASKLREPSTPCGKNELRCDNQHRKIPQNSIESWPISFRGTHHELSLGSDTGRRKTVKTTVTFVHYLRQLLTDNLKLNALLIIYAMTPSSPHPPW